MPTWIFNQRSIISQTECVNNYWGNNEEFPLKGTLKVGGNLPLKYCISGVLATKKIPPPPLT